MLKVKRKWSLGSDWYIPLMRVINNVRSGIAVQLIEYNLE